VCERGRERQIGVFDILCLLANRQAKRMERRVNDKSSSSVARVWLRSDQDDISNGFITKCLFCFFSLWMRSSSQ
jgi:hypothetical protein